MKECGLFKILQDKSIKNLVDYLTGIEVGLDSNARKNRGGTLMADKFENFLKSSGIAYNKEMNAKDVQKKYDINLSALTNSGKTVKRFDFVFKINEIVYGVEVNFYSTGGSKLNETARSYKQIAQESKAIENFRFM
jgi:type II restriction enzyme